MGKRVDRLGVVVALLLARALFAPFVVYRANRIVAGVGKSVLATGSAPGGAMIGFGLIVVILATIAVALLRTGAWLRLAMAVGAMLSLGLAVGVAALALSSGGSPYSRVALGWGAWVALFALLILFADAAVRLRISPLGRLGGVVLAGLVLALFLGSGIWRDLSILKEFSSRSADFWAEGMVHLLLAFGSLAAAILVGLPLGVLLERIKILRGPVLGVLNVVQTIPSIALFGMLIAPLAWLALRLPGLGAMGINGIGIAPAFIALFLYALLPMVATTLVGLTGVPRDVVDAGRGMGLTGSSCCFRSNCPWRCR